METLYSTLFAAHEDSCGMVITGEVESGLDDDEELGYWGAQSQRAPGVARCYKRGSRRLACATAKRSAQGRCLSLQFDAPIQSAAKPRRCGSASVQAGQDDIDCDMLERSVRALGAACLPVWAVGIYSRQNLEFEGAARRWGVRPGTTGSALSC